MLLFPYFIAVSFRTSPTLAPPLLLLLAVLHLLHLLARYCSVLLFAALHRHLFQAISDSSSLPSPGGWTTLAEVLEVLFLCSVSVFIAVCFQDISNLAPTSPPSPSQCPAPPPSPDSPPLLPLSCLAGWGSFSPPSHPPFSFLPCCRVAMPPPFPYALPPHASAFPFPPGAASPPLASACPPAQPDHASASPPVQPPASTSLPLQPPASAHPPDSGSVADLCLSLASAFTSTPPPASTLLPPASPSQHASPASPPSSASPPACSASPPITSLFSPSGLWGPLPDPRSAPESPAPGGACSLPSPWA